MLHVVYTAWGTVAGTVELMMKNHHHLLLLCVCRSIFADLRSENKLHNKTNERSWLPDITNLSIY